MDSTPDTNCVKNPYSILGVDVECSADELRKAYRKLVLQWHPDKNTSPEAPKIFGEISRAFALLSDPEKRSMYDRTGVESEINGTMFDHQHFDLSSILSSMLFSFGPEILVSKAHGEVEGDEEDIIDVDITLKEYKEGCVKRVEYEQPIKCPLVIQGLADSKVAFLLIGLKASSLIVRRRSRHNFA